MNSGTGDAEKASLCSLILFIPVLDGKLEDVTQMEAVWWWCFNCYLTSRCAWVIQNKHSWGILGVMYARKQRQDFRGAFHWASAALCV